MVAMLLYVEQSFKDVVSSFKVFHSLLLSKYSSSTTSLQIIPISSTDLLRYTTNDDKRLLLHWVAALATGEYDMKDEAALPIAAAIDLIIRMTRENDVLPTTRCMSKLLPHALEGVANNWYSKF